MITAVVLGAQFVVICAFGVGYFATMANRCDGEEGYAALTVVSLIGTTLSGIATLAMAWHLP